MLSPNFSVLPNNMKITWHENHSRTYRIERRHIGSNFNRKSRSDVFGFCGVCECHQHHLPVFYSCFVPRRFVDSIEYLKVLVHTYLGTLILEFNEENNLEISIRYLMLFVVVATFVFMIGKTFQVHWVTSSAYGHTPDGRTSNNRGGKK